MVVADRMMEAAMGEYHCKLEGRREQMMEMTIAHAGMPITRFAAISAVFNGQPDEQNFYF